ncbi:hypothetical protein OPIT5_16845 [Opitutaceae bacterium TAV5]|nr:hypothetical protein OPIT5_16845 [Opitutaceae bacterium TAV5]
MIRCRFLPLLVLALAPALSPVRAQSAPPPSPADREWRQSTVNRPRRVIVNNDGNEPVMMLRRPSAEDLLARRIAPLAGTQVDSLFYCTWSSGFGLFTHFTRVGQIFTSQENRHANNQMQALLDAGIDPLRVVRKFTREHDLELFWSMRMNDNHDGYADKYGPALFEANRLKMEHPEYLLGKRGERLPYGSWSAVNYARPEIRELAFRYIEEVCLHYDVDGVELDFFRHPLFFPSTTQGRPATAGELAMMTDLLRRVRAMTDAEGRRRGRPLLIAVRVPDSATYSRAIGLDLETWLSGDLVDLLVVGGYFQLNDWEESVTLARKHGVKIYPSLDDARVPDTADTPPHRSTLRMTDLAYRARVANALDAGADGVYFFNQFNPRRPIWREAGDPALLATLDKDYFASVPGVGATPMRSNLPLGPYQTIETLNPGAPRLLAPGQTARARIRLAESPASMERPPSFSLCLRIKNPDTKTNAPVAGHTPEIRFNDIRLDNPAAEGEWLVYPVTPDLVRRGPNEIRATLPSAAPASLQWLDLMMKVRHTRN